MTVFQPNLTTRLILDECRKLQIENVQSILEVGCGSAFITKALLDEGLVAPHGVWLSDISEEAIAEAKSVLVDYVSEDHFRVGSCLEPWREFEFDLIISDVAGIADEIASVSSWYQGVPFAAGSDGLINTLSVLDGATSALNEGGILIFPIISLSDTNRLIEETYRVFQSVTITNATFWPLPAELASQSELLERLCSSGMISLIQKYGKKLAFTRVAICTKIGSC